VSLRKIFGLTYENGYLRIKMNQEIDNKFKSPGILNVMKVCRFEWLGHVRMYDERIVKQLPEDKSGGGRRKRRLRLRWMDDVELE